MHRLFSILFSFLLVCLETSNQLAAEGGRRDDNKCLDKERLALLQFKSPLQDPYHFGCLSTWTAEEEDCCNWNRVTCHEQSGHVTELDLSFCYLVGKISHSLLNLTYLNYLDLTSNSFHGTIPKFIGSMTQLNHLDLSNSFHGTIPKFIGSMTQFKYLDLSFNSYHGTIPKFIGSMTQLNHLDLSANSFHGTIPKFIGSITRLKYLDLSYNYIDGTIPKFIGSMTQLNHLGLSGNSFHGTIPKFIGSMSQLKFLDLSYNSFSGTVPPEFGNLTNLQELRLGYVGRCRVENIEWLSRLSHLEDLRMDGISLAKANHWVDLILSLRKLSVLGLSGCELSQVMHPYSSSFLNSSSSSIEHLFLGNNNLNSSMYRWLFPLTTNKLHSLYLSSNMLDGIPTYLGNLCSLETLYFDNNSAVVEFPVFLNNLSGCTSLSLQDLSLSDNHLTGSLPDEIQKFPSLTYLYLSNNQLNGTISEKLWQLPKLYTLDLSKNSLLVFPSSDHMSNLSYIEEIDLSSCKLGPHFPKWIQNLKNLTTLNLANTGISDTIPLEFWDASPSQLRVLNLSSNNIHGKLPDLLSNFYIHSVIDLSSNRFHGPIPNVPSYLISLNLSKNNLSGGISFLCQLVDGFLLFLDLSQNFLSGQLPDCLWQFTELRVLNLGNNNLFGRLPNSVKSLTKLEVLDLYNNEFSGELPLSLQNCTRLNVLNLGANKFSGNVPIWIGENLFRLYVIILTSNNFFGTIPLQYCQLANLQILDLSKNNLHGNIPSCVNNFTAMVQEGPLEHQNQHKYENSFMSGVYLDHAMIGWQGVEREFFNNLILLKMIDLSSNNLTGPIPHEITNLHELIALNLSKNALHGEIPRKIGQMKKLLVLDLSRNFLSGEIPTSMSQMTLLSYLDVSSNNLSGRIPSGTQLQSFDSSSYSGNVGLCGLPLPQKGPGDEVPSVVGKSEGDGEDKNEDWGLFYIGIGTGFATGFWIVCGTLLLNRRGRHAFFHFYDSFKDWIYVKVMVFIANLKKDEHR